MSDYVKELARKALEKAKQQKPRAPARHFEEEPTGKSEDALDHRGFRKGGFSRAEKMAYAQEKHMEDLLQPPKNPPPAWLSDPSLLPKRPPGKHE